MRMALIMLFSVAVAGSGGHRRDWLKEWLRVGFQREQVSLGGEALAAGIAADVRRRRTRWQGMMIGMGLLPLACPTERALPPASRAMSIYERVSPYGIAHSACHTRCR